MVLDDKADLPNAVGQEAEVAPALVLFRAAVGEHVHAWGPHFLHSSGSSCTSGPRQVVVSDLLHGMEVEVEVVSRVLGSKHPRLAQVDPAASLPELQAEVYDSHHEGSCRMPRASEDGLGFVSILLDEVRFDDDVAVRKRFEAEPVGFVCHLAFAWCAMYSLLCFLKSAQRSQSLPSLETCWLGSAFFPPGISTSS